MKLIRGSDLVDMFHSLSALNLISEALRYPDDSPERKALLAAAERATKATEGKEPDAVKE